jgi:hypothetical protein
MIQMYYILKKIFDLINLLFGCFIAKILTLNYAWEILADCPPELREAIYDFFYWEVQSWC